MKCKLIMILIALMTLLPIGIAKQEITENNFRITSDKETYYCQPVRSSDGGCLIKGYIEIENLDTKNHNIDLGIDSTTEIRIRKHKDIEKQKTKKFKTNKKTNIKKNEILRIPFEFYAYENGKFDYYVEGDLFKTILDPFYNVSYNASSPSYWLEDGIVDTENDNLFSQTEISSYLYDGLDSPSFSTYTGLYSESQNNQTDGTWESYWYIASESDIQAVDFDLDLSLIDGDVTACYVVGNNQAGIKGNVTINNTDTGIQFDTPNTATPTDCIWVEIPKSYLITGTNRIGYTCSGCSPKRSYIGADEDNPDDTSWFYDGTWSQQTAIDYAIILNYSLKDASTGNAISTKFDISLNDNNNYWLEYKKTTSGIANLTIFNYLNETHINTNINDLINTGYDVTDINPLITNDTTPRFRIYTENSHNFTEIYLIEEIEDNENPVINDYAVNNTELTCDEHIRLYANVTDNEIIDDVYFTFYDDSYNVVMADNLINTNIYYYDYQITGEKRKIYNFTDVNATDIVGLKAHQNFQISYNYTCDLTDPITTLNSPADDTITNETSINFQCSATDNQELSNITLYHNLSGSFNTIDTKIITGTADSDTFSDVIPYNRTIVWTCYACDYLNNCDYATNRTLRTNQTFVEIQIQPNINISLIQPSDNSKDNDGFVTFIFYNNKSGLYNLYINDNINQTKSLNTGSQAFDEIFFGVNGTYTWYVESENTTSETWNLIINKTQDRGLKSPFDYGSCPDNLTNAFLFAFFIMFALVFIILGFVLDIGVLGVLGSVGLLLLSFYVFACMVAFGLFVLLLSLFLIMWFSLKGMGFVN